MFHISKLNVDIWFYKGGKCGCFVLINKLLSWGQSTLRAIQIEFGKYILCAIQVQCANLCIHWISGPTQLKSVPKVCNTDATDLFFHFGLPYKCVVATC